MLLETPRLLLRRFQPEDTAAFAAYRSDPAVARYQSWTAPVPAAEAAALVRELADGDPGQPGWFQYAVEVKAAGGLAGDVGVNLHENRRQAELGFTLAPQWQGQGYASEAARAMLQDLFSRRGLHRNLRSARLLERVGFQQEGRRPEFTWIKGEWTDDLLFGLLASRWTQLTARAPR
jgi:RimJ/RimL family protein N-acetyltransferase